MLTESRTLNDIFNKEYKELKEYCTWRNFWDRIRCDALERYYKEGWYIIPIAIRDKRPMRGYCWDKKPLTEDRAINYIMKDLNIAVVLGKSDLVCLDLETHAIPPPLLSFTENTYMSITPRGYHFYFECYRLPSARVFERLTNLLDPKKYTFEFRSGIQYCLLPYSVVKKEGEPPKVYEWIKHNSIIDFKVFVKELLKDAP